MVDPWSDDFSADELISEMNRIMKDVSSEGLPSSFSSIAEIFGIAFPPGTFELGVGGAVMLCLVLFGCAHYMHYMWNPDGEPVTIHLKVPPKQEVVEAMARDIETDQTLKNWTFYPHPHSGRLDILHNENPKWRIVTTIKDNPYTP